MKANDCVNATELRHFVVENSEIEKGEVLLNLVLWQSTAVQQGPTSVQQFHLSRGLDGCSAWFSVHERKHGMLRWCHDRHTSFFSAILSSYPSRPEPRMTSDVRCRG